MPRSPHPTYELWRAVLRAFLVLSVVLIGLLLIIGVGVVLGADDY